MNTLITCTGCVPFVGTAKYSTLETSVCAAKSCCVAKVANIDSSIVDG